MKIKVTTIDFEIPRRTKRIAMIAGLPAATLLGAAALAYAGVPNTFSSGEPLSSSQMNANFSSLDARITTLETAPQAVPVGTIIAFGGTTAPAGWVYCDGTSYSGTNATYAALFAAIGTAYGGQTATMAFNVPDLRGRFVRGADDGSGHDPDAANRVASATGGNALGVGSLEAAAFASHSHGVNDPGHSHGFSAYDWDNGVVGGHWLGGGTSAPDNPNTTFWTESLATAASGTGITIQAAAGGTETRPLNVAVSYIIKL